jgi:hypothetical protein
MVNYEENNKNHRPNNVDNISPAEPQYTTNEILIRIGRFADNLGLDDIMFCKMLEVIENLKHFIGKQENIEIDFVGKNTRGKCFNSNNKTPKTRTKKRPIITDDLVAKAMGISQRDFRYRKERIIKKLKHLDSAEKLPPE